MASKTKGDAAHIEVMSSPEDIIAGFDVVAACFGTQIQDGIFMAMNPGWDNSEGRQAGAQRMLRQWKTVTKDRHGNPNTIFLKATVPASNDKPDGPRKIVGVATWIQLSYVEGHGSRPVEDISTVSDLNELYPGNKAEQNYLVCLMRSLHAQRDAHVKSKSTAPVPAVYALDMCVVDPAYQGRGIAKQLVKWGIAEAERRGGLELVTEGSIMGRRVYEKLGFKPQSEVVYEVDPPFESRPKPSNLFMRTGDGS